MRGSERQTRLIDTDACSWSDAQADETPYVRVLSSTGTKVRVAFYGEGAKKLAGSHPVVQAVIDASKKPRNGCYLANTAALVAAADMPPHQVCRDAHLQQRPHTGVFNCTDVNPTSCT